MVSAALPPLGGEHGGGRVQAQRGGQVPHVHRRPGQGGQPAAVTVGPAAPRGRLAGHAGPRDGAPRAGEQTSAPALRAASLLAGLHCNLSLLLPAFQLPLLEKKHQLKKQLTEAQDLKDHVDRREQAVSRVLARCLSPEQHRDYWYTAVQFYSIACVLSNQTAFVL